MSFILWGVALVTLFSAAFNSTMIWFAGLVLALAVASTFFQACLYRPPEAHLGVIYKYGRLSRLVGSDEWVFIFPGVDQIKDPLSLRVSQVEINLTDELTQDQIPFNCHLLVYYQLDLRRASPDFQPQALRISVERWPTIIRTKLQEIAGEVSGGFTFQQLLTPDGRRRYRRTLNALLTDKVQHLGLVINPQTGVSIQGLKPTDDVWRAMVDRVASVSLGEAALARVQPIMKELSQCYPEIGYDAFLLEWAAVLAKKGTVPRTLVAPTWGQVQASLPAIYQPTSADQSQLDETISTPDDAHEWVGLMPRAQNERK
jgi:regulator of protease activity HflC (stomatin/prohibitin superfamily)